MTRDERDVEARLRSSLRAYADVVDDEPVRSPRRAAGSARSSGFRGWRSSVLAAAAVLAVAGGTWVVLDAANDSSPTAASGGGDAAVLEGDSRAESAPEQSTESSAEALAGAAEDATAAGEELALPSPVEVGVAYPFDLYTHCGIDGADIGGVWFAPDPPLDEDASSWPAGWGNPYQRGTLTLVSADEAVFRDDAGYELRLRAVSDSERPPRCE